MGATQQEPRLELPNSEPQRERIRSIDERGLTRQLRHCVTVGVEIRGPVDEIELRARMAGVTHRRPALGSLFTRRGTHRPSGGSPVLRRQTVDAPDAESRWRLARDMADFESQRPFALGEQPLVRGLLLSTEDDRHLLVLNFDQLVSDAWSANLVVDDLFGEMGADSSGEPDEYCAVWREREDWLSGPDGAAAVKRRRGVVADARLHWPVPVDPDPDEPEAAVETFLAVDDAITEVLRGRVREVRGTLLATGAMALALSNVENPSEPLALLSTLAGRESPAEQAVVGWFANEAIIRLPPRAGTILEYATALRAEIFAVLSDQRVPFELLRSALLEETTEGPSCALVFLPKGLSGGRQSEQRFADAVATRTGVSICPTGADIDFFLIEDAPPMSSAPRAALTAGVSTWSGVASQETADRLLQRWIATLSALADLPWSRTLITDVAGRPADWSVPSAPPRATPL